MSSTSDDPTSDLPPEQSAAGETTVPDNDSDAASDVKQFLDIDPPESPAADADVPAPPG